MDAGIAVRPTTGVAATDYARPNSAPVQQAVQTDLAASKTVTAAAPSENLRYDALAGRNPAQTRQYVIDPQTHEVIFRIMDTRTRQVVRQVPDEALLRMRAYAKALSEGKNPSSVDLQTDFQA